MILISREYMVFSFPGSAISPATVFQADSTRSIARVDPSYSTWDVNSLFSIGRYLVNKSIIVYVLRWHEQSS